MPCGWIVLVSALATIAFDLPANVSAQERRPMRPNSDVITAPPATTANIDSAIAKAEEFLYSRQRDGNWEEAQTRQPLGEDRRGPGGMMGARGERPEQSSQWGGLTSIATFALLEAGEETKDPRIAKATSFLQAGNITGTYALGLHAQVWNSMPVIAQKEFHASVVKDAGILLKGLRQTGEARGLYHYTPDDAGWDNSCSQFGVLGMWACSQLGYEVPNKYWKDVEDAWIRHQDKSGGWTYGPNPFGAGMGPPGAGPNGAPPGAGPGGPPRPGPGGRRGGGPNFGVSLSMTAAGVATLFITQDYLHGDAGADCKGNFRNPNIDAGLKWIVDHYSNLASDRHYYYTLFGISRIGLASGLKYLGDKDWYADGAAALLASQQPDGSWDQSVSDTAFALLFLARGQAPVMMNKLQYDLADAKGNQTQGPWNERPRDAANLARWTGRNIEHGLKWQIVNLSVSSADLHEAPVLYISGSKALSFTAAQLQTLRNFAEEGGLILGNADCAKSAFPRSFEKLGNALFPKYEFRDLPGDHPIFANEQYSAAKWHTKPKVRGLSNGVRELMVLIPDADPSRAWQGRNEKIREESYQLGANIFLYSVDKKNLLKRGETYLVKEDPKIQTQKSIAVARLIVGENPDPEPAGWRRLAAIMHNRQLAVVVSQTKCDGDALKGFQLAHFTGTTRFELDDTQRAALKAFVQGGGTLVIDAAGGSAEFADSAEAELASLFPGQLKALAPESAVFGDPQTKKTATVEYRAFAKRVLPADTKLPRLKTVEINGRNAVFFSREDLTAGLVGEPVDGVYGYAPASATRLMSDILRYASASATTKPSVATDAINAGVK
jgi:hypothetical protein